MKRLRDHRIPAVVVYAPPMKARAIAWFKRAEHKRERRDGRRQSERAAADELTRMRAEDGL